MADNAAQPDLLLGGLAFCESEGQVPARATCREILLAAGAVPDWIELIPAGHVKGFDGREFVNDRPQQVVDAFNSHPHDLPLDWEHASEREEVPEGPNPSPAAGWIVALENRAGAIWAQIDWNERGRASVASREYRYVSPAFFHDAQGHVLKLSSAALTNRPNLTQRALNRRTEETPMLKKLLALLALAENTTEDQALEAVRALNSKVPELGDELKTSRATTAKLTDELAEHKTKAEKAAADLAISQAARQTPDLDKWVPRADFDAARHRVAALETAEREVKAAQLKTEVDTTIEAAKKEGYITPATEEFYRDTCLQPGGLEKFRAFAAKATKVIADPTTPTKPPPVPGIALTEEELAICEMAGTDPAQMALFKSDPKAWAKAQKAD